LILGCIADDFTGATDLAGILVDRGVATVVLPGVPTGTAPVGAQAAVVALKSRTAPADVAVRESVAALRWLRSQGCQRFYFKYCSTFDSTPQGNIGPVTDALMTELDVDYTVACPAFPANGRTVYNGHLFVGGDLLHESSMRRHPLTPMDDANLVRVLARQTPSQVGLIPRAVVAAGPEAIRARIREHRATGVRMAVVDAIEDGDLTSLGAACSDLPLVTAASGLAHGVADTVPHAGTVSRPQPLFGGASAVLAGSASEATAAQIRAMKRHHPAFEVDPCAVLAGEDVASAAVAWAAPRLDGGPVLIHTTSTRAETSTAAAKLEQTLATTAVGLVRAGVRRLVVAGGETSGAVVQALGVQALHVGPEVSPGVPWTYAMDRPQPIALVLKSGNFGSVDLFTRAFEVLP